MRIATMVRGYLPVPRPDDIVYAPIDLAIDLSACLQKLGHRITFYAPKGSNPPSKLQSLGREAFIKNNKEFQRMLRDIWLQSHYVPALYDLYYARDMFEQARAGKYDVLYFHHPEVAVPFAALYPDVPVVYTLHDPIFEWYQEMFRMYYSKNQFFISISKSQRKAAPKLNYAATVYNGIDVSKFTYAPKHKDYLFYVGRIVPDKGVAEAVQLARKTGSKLLLAGPIFPDSQDYFDKKIKPYLNDKIKYLGFMAHDKLPKYMQGAKAFLMPIKWDEPFGITMVEALASGTPVIGTNRGSVSEVVEDGVSGFVVNNMSEMVAAVNKIDTISRAACRERAVQMFTDIHMARGYEAAFQKAIDAVKLQNAKK